MKTVKQIFYGAVRATTGLSTYPQVLCLYGEDNALLWEGVGNEISFSNYTSGLWETRFDRGRLDENEEACSDTETESVTATVSIGEETGEVTFSYQSEFYRFPFNVIPHSFSGEGTPVDEDSIIEFSPETLFGSEEAFTGPQADALTDREEPKPQPTGAPHSTLYGDLDIVPRNNGTGGDLYVSGNIHAANYPPETDDDTGREIAVLVGDGQRRVFFVTHTLGVREVNITVYSDADNSKVLVRCVIQSVGNICITFVDPPEADETFTVIIQK